MSDHANRCCSAKVLRRVVESLNFLMSTIEDFLSRCILKLRISISTITAIIQAISFSIIATWYNILQHYSFKIYAYDLGIYMQALYTTAFKGMLLYETPDLYHVSSGSFLGVHFTPLTLLLVPLYKLFPRAEILFMVQNLAIGLSSLFIYLIARGSTRSHLASLVLQLIYLMNPLIHAAVMFPFHIEVFVPLFGLAALYFLQKRMLRAYIVNIVLLTITIDFAIPIAGAIALYGLIKSGNRKEALLNTILITFSIAMLFIAVRIISMFGPEPLSFGGQLEILGSNWREVLINLLTRPDKVAKAISYDLVLKMANIFMLLMPYLPMVFNDLISLLPSLPYIVLSLLTQRNSIYLPGWHIQGLFAVPFISFAAIKGIEDYIKKRNSLNEMKTVNGIVRMIAKAFVLSLIAMLLLSPAIVPEDYIHSIVKTAPLGAAYISRPDSNNEKYTFLHEIIRHIPPEASVLAQNHIFPHLANRVDAYVWLPPNVTVDYAIADLNQHDYYTKHGDVPFSKQFELLLVEGYKLCVSGYGVMLIAREECPIKLLMPFRAVYTYENITAGSFEIVNLDGYRVLRYVPKEPVFVFGPYVTLPPGTYNVTFWLRLDSPGYEGYVGKVDVSIDLGGTILASRPLYGFMFRPGEWIPVSLIFSSTGVLHNVEFRVIDTSNNVGRKFYLLGIEVKQISLEVTPSLDTYLTYTNLIVKGAIVENGLILHRPQDPHDVLWYGPYISLKEGRYKALLAMKFENVPTTAEIVMQIDVCVERGTHRIALLNITKDMIREGEWIVVSLDFSLDRSYPDVEIRGLNAIEGTYIRLAYIHIIAVMSEAT